MSSMLKEIIEVVQNFWFPILILVIFPMIWIIVKSLRAFFDGYLSIQKKSLERDYIYRKETEDKLHSFSNVYDTIESLKSFNARFSEVREKEFYEIKKSISYLITLQEKLKIDVDSQKKALTDFADISKNRENLSHDQIISIYKQVSSEYTHSINSPLSAVDTAVKNLKAKLPTIIAAYDSEKEAKIFVDLIENADIAVNTIHAILDRGAGFFPGEAEIFSIDDLVRKAVRMTRERAESKATVSVDLKIPHLKYHWLNLLIAVIQILENAFEAINENGLISISGKFIETDNLVRLKISNNGEPIQNNCFENLFSRNFTTKGHGRGTGLSIAKRCIETVDGKVSLVKSDGEMTVFEIVFSPIGD